MVEVLPSTELMGLAVSRSMSAAQPCLGLFICIDVGGITYMMVVHRCQRSQDSQIPVQESLVFQILKIVILFPVLFIHLFFFLKTKTLLPNLKGPIFLLLSNQDLIKRRVNFLT